MKSWNQEWLQAVAPADWVNPQPRPRYHLVVVGAGPAGLVAAVGAAGLGARVALVERHHLGGDCLNYGCVPSKALIHSAQVAATLAEAPGSGVFPGQDWRVDFPQVMDRLRRLRSQLAPNDSAQRLRSLGIDVFLGEGRFVSPEALEVKGARLRFSRACLATGASSRLPAIPGLRERGYLTNQSLFDLTELPPRLAILGAGPVGVEMAQAFARLGSQVQLIHTHERILSREEPEASEFLQNQLSREGVEIWLNRRLEQVSPDGTLWPGLQVDQILLAAGRQPNLEGLGLESAGVAFDGNGVQVDDHLRTSNPRIYAAGDVCGQQRFTHAADAMARIVLRNALFGGRARSSHLLVPWCTYCQPELARVGLSCAQAERAGRAWESLTVGLDELDRPRLQHQSGFLKLVMARGRDRILGATLVAPAAGDLISGVTTAMKAGKGLGFLAEVIQPYPTTAEVLKRAADQYNRRRLTPLVKFCLRQLLRWRHR